MTNTTTATRNRAIKATLSKAFPGIKVTVRGDRGTAAGYVSAHVHYAPASFTASDELTALAITLLERAGVNLGHRYTDDTCQFSTTDLSLKFDRPREAA